MPSPAAQAFAEKHEEHAQSCNFDEPGWPNCFCSRPARVAALAADIEAAMVMAVAAAMAELREKRHSGGYETGEYIDIDDLDDLDPAAIVAALEPA